MKALFLAILFMTLTGLVHAAEPDTPTLACRRIVSVIGLTGSSPARIDWTPDLTLTAAITASGQFTRESLPEVIVIRHVLRKGGRTVAHPRAILKGTEADPKLLPNDTIEVPQ